MFARGMSGPKIAAELGVSTATIYGVKKWAQAKAGDKSE